MSIDDFINKENVEVATRAVDKLALEMLKNQASEDRQIEALAESGQIALALELVNGQIERVEEHTRNMPESIYYLSHILTLGYLRKMLVLKKKRKVQALDSQSFTALLADYLDALDKIIALGPFLPRLNADHRSWSEKILAKSQQNRAELLVEINKRKIALPG